MSLSKIATVAALASTLAFAAGCASNRAHEVPQGPVAAQYVDSMQYGYVRNITVTDAGRSTTGAGAIIGGVVGAVVGNQIGSGSGRAAATGAGAVGGALLGNKIEEGRNEPNQVYSVEVQTDNGRMESFNYRDLNGLRIGDRVRIRGGQLERY